MRIQTLILLGLALVLVFGATTQAAPELIDYQGYLEDDIGNPITDTLSLTFTIYTASSGGTSKWTETQSNVAILGGLFNVTLGSSTALLDSVFNDNTRYLAVSIGGSELSPRTRIVSTAYSHRVNTIDGASGGTISGDVKAGKGNFGTNNTNAGTYAFVAGENNIASGNNSVVTGGLSDTASAIYATVGGGYKNKASDTSAVVSGGYDCKATKISATVSGGYWNSATGRFSSIGGGVGNGATATVSAVSGGYYDTASGEYSVVSGGFVNKASGVSSVVSGGEWNIAEGQFSTVSGGSNNTSSDTLGSVGGGSYNEVSGKWATVPGGHRNEAIANYSFAAGRRAKANHDGAFVWADSDDNDFSSSASNQFNVRSVGGVRIYTNTGLTAGVTLSAGGSSWNSVSDSTLKRNARLVCGSEILSKLMQLPIKQWSYESQSANIEHVGPMAQDFYSAFGLGDDNLTISNLDPSGIALAAIQEVYRQVRELQKKNLEIETLKNEMSKLKLQIDALSEKTNGAGNGKLATIESK